ncbi:MAG TPA: TetR/AcrR family transcriptional regulator [Acidimicrobiales bacterium]|nr:TetR/AcrR family transcriptional regulator [Acidimicrobiales bacterium]
MTSTKQRLIETSADLFQRQGYAGTGVKQIVEAAQAPFGSMYHHFPDGKAQLGAETLRWSGAQYGLLIDLVYGSEPDVVAATRLFFEAAADTVRDTDYADACPIATVALEVASTSEPLRAACAEVFEDWLAVLDRYLRDGGVADEIVRPTSEALFCLLEGAFLLARVTRDDGAVRRAGVIAVSTVSAAIGSD